MGKISPFAPNSVPHLPAIEGVRIATAAAGIRYPGRIDLLLALFDPGTTVAGVLTKSKTASAPVDWCRAHLAHGMARALVVNSGNANAFTGKRGKQAVTLTAEAAARAADCLEADVYIASTGVIGEPLDAGKIVKQLGGLVCEAKADAYADAARAIMTTDTFPKLATRKAEIDGVSVTINGIAKGAGMIAPDMATLLVFLFTDAAIEPRALRACLDPGVDNTFNAVTIDGDTSTSDTLLIFATGRATSRGAPRIVDWDDLRLAGFRLALAEVMHDLALQVVKDGEGLTKFVSVKVTGAEFEAGRAHHRQVDRQLAPGQDGNRRRGPELGAHRRRRRQGGRSGGPRPAGDLVRRYPRRQGWGGRVELCREGWRGLHAGAGDRHYRRCRRG